MTDKTAPVLSTAGFAVALSIAALALLICHLALRASTPGALLAGAPIDGTDATTRTALAATVGLERSDLARPEVTERIVAQPAAPEVEAPVVLRGRALGIDAVAMSRFVVDVGLGAIDPVDRAERDALQAAGQSAAELSELYSFESRVSTVLAADGSFEVGLASAPRYQVIVHDHERFAVLERDLPEVAPRSAVPRIVELGSFEIPLATALRVALRPARDPEPLATGPYALEIARADPTLAGTEFASVLPQVAPSVAEALFHGVRFSLNEPRRIVPFLPDERLNVTVVSGSGLRSRAFEVSVARGTEQTLDIALEDAFPRGQLARYAGRFVCAGDRSPIAYAKISCDGASPIVSDENGRFELVAIRSDRLTLTLTQFDRELEERVEYVEVAPLETTGEPTFEIETTRWLCVTGLAPPPEITFSEPLAYRLEMRKPGANWQSIAVDRMTRTPDSLLVSVTHGEAEYRLVAIWSAVHSLASEPAVLLAADRRATTAFGIPTEAPSFVAGRIVSDAVGGEPFDGIVVEATAPGCGGIPPVAVQAESDGRFLLGPIRAEWIEVTAHLRSGDVVREIEPHRTPNLEIEAVSSSSSHTAKPARKGP